MANLSRYKKNIYSQGGEDGILEYIFDKLKINDGWAVEVGALDGIKYSNTYSLILKGWSAVLIEENPECFTQLVCNMKQFTKAYCFNEHISLEIGHKLDDVLARTPIPSNFDLCSIDIDGMDYWIWKEFGYHPKVVVIEYNQTFKGNPHKIFPYSSDYTYDRTNNYGTGHAALAELGSNKGYFLATRTKTNLVFIDVEYEKIINE